MHNNFEACLRKVLVYEGGYSNHPKDPGGVTLEGVIQRVYDAYRKKKNLPQRPLTPDMRNRIDWIKERNEIYRSQYWDAVKGDLLPAGVDLVVFDGAVNSGPVQSIKWLQRALNLAIADGSMGDVTLLAIKNCKNYDQLVADICGRRMAFLQQLKTWGTFRKGWSTRVVGIKASGQQMASGPILAQDTPPPPIVEAKAVEARVEGGANAKASPRDVSEAPVSVGAGTAGTTVGTVTSGVLDPLQTATASLTPFSDTIQIIKYVVIALTIAVAGITLYGIWRNYKAQRALNGEDISKVPPPAEEVF